MRRQNLKYISFARYITTQKEEKKTYSILEYLNKLIVLLTSGSVLFIAVLYIAGRHYAAAYFNAMNIPEYMMVFSVNEYSAVSWLPVFIYTILIIIISLIFMKIILHFKEILIFFSRIVIIPIFVLFLLILKTPIKIPISQKIFKYIKEQKEKINIFIDKLINRIYFSTLITDSKNFTQQLERNLFFFVNRIFSSQNLERRKKYSQLLSSLILIAFSAISLISFFTYTLLFLEDFGSCRGKKQVIEHANIINIHSKNPLPLNNGTIINCFSDQTNEQYYSYDRFRLLTLNDGKYYLFKDLDPETCKPEQVYIIDESSVDQVILSPAEDISDQCQN